MTQLREGYSIIFTVLPLSPQHTLKEGAYTGCIHKSGCRGNLGGHLRILPTVAEVSCNRIIMMLRVEGDLCWEDLNSCGEWSLLGMAEGWNHLWAPVPNSLASSQKELKKKKKKKEKKKSQLGLKTRDICGLSLWTVLSAWGLVLRGSIPKEIVRKYFKKSGGSCFFFF